MSQPRGYCQSCLKMDTSVIWIKEVFIQVTCRCVCLTGSIIGNPSTGSCCPRACCPDSGESLVESCTFSTWLDFSSCLSVFPSLHLTSVCPALCVLHLGIGDSQNHIQWVINTVLVNWQYWHKAPMLISTWGRHPHRFELESLSYPLSLFWVRRVKQGGLWKLLVTNPFIWKGEIAAKEEKAVQGYSKLMERGLLTPLQASFHSTRKGTC